MSFLDLHKRPVVAFDATNNEHRKWFASFTRTGTWKGCPFRFIVTDAKGQITSNLIVGMTNQVTQFYLNQEFKQKKSYYKRKSNVSQADKGVGGDISAN